MQVMGKTVLNASSQGWTPFHKAAYYGNIDIFTYLMDKQDLDSKTE